MDIATIIAVAAFAISVVTFYINIYRKATDYGTPLLQDYQILKGILSDSTIEFDEQKRARFESILRTRLNEDINRCTSIYYRKLLWSIVTDGIILVIIYAFCNAILYILKVSIFDQSTFNILSILNIVAIIYAVILFCRARNEQSHAGDTGAITNLHFKENE